MLQTHQSSRNRCLVRFENQKEEVDEKGEEALVVQEDGSRNHLQHQKHRHLQSRRRKQQSQRNRQSRQIHWQAERQEEGVWKEEGDESRYHPRNQSL